MSKKIYVKKETAPVEEYDQFVEKVRRYEITRDRDTNDVEVNFTEDDIIELEYADGTIWLGAPSELAKLGGHISAKRSGEEHELPLEIFSEDSTRGLGSLVLNAFQILTKKSTPVYATLHAALDSLEDFIKVEGLYSVNHQFELTEITGSLPVSEPYLLFLHGTLSSTEGSFGKLKENESGPVWNQLVNTYKNRILALEHKTVTKSPLANVYDCLRQLPDGIKLHVVSHSRGGIVADLLSLCNDKQFPIQDFVDAERKEDLAWVQKIKTEIKNKQIEVEKMIRVASPSAGTTVLSDRYVDFLNTLLNVIRVTAPHLAPMAARIKKMIVAIYSMKDNELVLPGLEAMVPGSAFQVMLNRANASSTKTATAFIAGDGVASLSLKGLGTILSNLFYWHDNDWVVDSESMDKGIIRKGNVYYLFSQHKEVNHFSYFSNSDTRAALVWALLRPEKDWVKYFQLRAEGGHRGILFKTQMGSERHTRETFKNLNGTKPVIVLVPGILGSNLHDVKDPNNPKRIFLDDKELMLGGFVKKLNIQQPNIEAQSISGKAYNRFVEFFSDQYDVLVFPYDWRKSIKESATQLGKFLQDVQAKVKNQPINLVAHSMGGLVCRHLAVVDNALFQSLSKHANFKLIFLGSPLQGAYIVPQILLGQGAIFKAFSFLDFPHSAQTLRNTFREYPGLVNLLPLRDKREYENAAAPVWRELAQVVEGFQPPDVNLLKEFEREVGQVEETVYRNPKVFYVAGHSDKTLCDYEIKDSFFKGRHVQFLSTNQGDGKVTWATGIPSIIKEDKRVYYTETEHGNLASDTDNFKGLQELLLHGRTTLLSSTPPSVRGQEVISYYTEDIPFDGQEESLHQAIFGKPRKSNRSQAVQIQVSVTCGDVRYVKYPVMVGHFRNDGIVSAEKAINNYLGKRLSLKHELKIYPEDIGTSDVFLNNRNNPAAVVVGLGNNDQLTSSSLERTIMQAAINYMLICNSREGIGNELGLSVLLIGSSFAGLSLDSSIKSILSGIQNANAVIQAKGGYKPITQVEFIELFEDKAVQTLKLLIKEERNNRLSSPVRLLSETLNKEKGRRQRIVYEMMDDWWSQLTILKEQSEDIPTHLANFRFSASSSAAKVDIRKNTIPIHLIHSRMERMAERQEWDMDMARQIFELLIPNDFKPAVRNQQHILLNLDLDTACIPWELLHDTKTYSKPLATQVGIVRRMEYDNANMDITYVSDLRALVIGDPFLNNEAKQLPYARQEAEEVITILEQENFSVIPKLKATDDEIIGALYADTYKIIHLAGHGEYAESGKQPHLRSGMLIGEGRYLSSNYITNLSYVPDLVFINCCHIGHVSPDIQVQTYNQHKLASNISLELMRKGVKCVVAAAWAIDDKAARRFTEVFYQSLLDGRNFGETVLAARAATYQDFPNKNTWAAYQCYGDQFYTLTSKKTKGPEDIYYDQEEVRIDLQNLYNRVDVDKDGVSYFEERLQDLEQRIEKSNLRKSSKIHTLMAEVYAQIRNYDKAIENYREAIKLSSIDMPAEVHEKLYWMLYKKYYNELLEGKDTTVDLEDVLKRLHHLVEYNSTYERNNLLGSIYKMKACFESDKKLFEQWLKLSATFYKTGSTKTTYEKPNTIYPLSNSILMQAIGDMYKKGNKRKNYLQTLTQEYNNCKKYLNLADYWDKMVETNFIFIETMFADTLAEHKSKLVELKKAVSDAWATGGSVNKKISEMEHMDMLILIYKRWPLENNTVYSRDLKFLEEFKQFLVELDNPEERIFD